jgi:hypothetical protein
VDSSVRFLWAVIDRLQNLLVHMGAVQTIPRSWLARDGGPVLLFLSVFLLIWKWRLLQLISVGWAGWPATSFRTLGSIGQGDLVHVYFQYMSSKNWSFLFGCSVFLVTFGVRKGYVELLPLFKFGSWWNPLRICWESVGWECVITWWIVATIEGGMVHSVVVAVKKICEASLGVCVGAFVCLPIGSFLPPLTYPSPLSVPWRWKNNVCLRAMLNWIHYFTSRNSLLQAVEVNEVSEPARLFLGQPCWHGQGEMRKWKEKMKIDLEPKFTLFAHSFPHFWKELIC